MISKLKRVVVTSILSILASTSIAQNNSGKLHVHDQPNGDGIAVHQNKVFDAGQGILSTEKHKGEESQILFSNASSWEGASDLSYIDGFVKSDHNSGFIFPVGSNGHFKPMACSKPKGISVAYFSNDSSFDVEKSENGVKLLNKSTYWVAQGSSPTQLTFSWNKKDNVSTITEGDITKLKILGFNGSVWEVIDSKVESFPLDTKNSNKNYLETPSDLMNGAVSTSKEIIPNQYMAYALGISNTDKVSKNTAIAAKVRNKNTVDINRERIDLSGYKIIKSIHFPFTESEITRYSTHLLQKLAGRLEEANPRIRLVGHADFYGSNDFNYQLGLDRANAVKDMLASLGLNLVKVDVVSKGENVSKSGCDNCSTRETIIDRRVDIYILED